MSVDFKKLAASMRRDKEDREVTKDLHLELLNLFGILKDRRVRIVVTGGRNYADRRMVDAVFYRVMFLFNIILLIEGGARGADRLSSDWAIENDVLSLRVLADWNKHGKSAGRLRNKQMIDIMPHFVIAFPGNVGTQHCISLAEAASIPVIRVPDRRHLK